MQELKNSSLQIRVNEKGAELSSLFSPLNHIEYLWQANPAYWPRHAPVLFPVVGKLKDNHYTYQNRLYEMQQHGFARDRLFTLIEKSHKQLVFSLRADENSLQQYPFDFELQIEYVLQEQSLEIIYRVINHDPGEIWFSIGAHPGFNCPLTAGTVLEDYFLQFNHKEKAEQYLIEQGLQTGESRPFLENRDIIPLNKEIFAHDALIFKNLLSETISLKNKKNKHGLTLHFKGFPCLGIWAKPGAPFVCIEPWHGIASPKHSGGELVHKEGIISLPPGNTFSCNYLIEVF